MKKQILSVAFAALAGVAAAEGSAWRVSAGGRMRFGIDSSFRMKGGFVKPSAYAPAAHPSSDKVMSDLESQAAGTGAGTGRVEFDNGFINFNDHADEAGKTCNWGADASALNGNTLTFSTAYTDQSVQEMSSTFTGGESDEWTSGVSLEFARTLWQDDNFGLDLSFGFSWFDDVDILKSSGSIYQRTVTTENGTIDSSITTKFDSSEPGLDNGDGTIGKGYDYTAGYNGPGAVIEVPSFSFTKGPDGLPIINTTDLWMSAHGEMSMLEAQLALEPYVCVWDRLYLRGKVGLAMIATNVSIKGEVAENGNTIWRGSDREHDITFAGVLGLSAAYYFTDNFFVQCGAEVLLGANDVDIDNEFVKGEVGVGDFGCGIAIGFTF